jgi:hypothetical protein
MASAPAWQLAQVAPCFQLAALKAAQSYLLNLSGKPHKP